MASIQLERIVKDYGNLRAIQGIDLEISDGEFVAFVGPSGCGKSTLLRMVAGLEEISGGTLRIGDRVVNDMEPRDRDVAMVFQDYALYPHMTIAENIGFGLKMRGIKQNEIEKQVKKAAGILQIGELLERKPGQLSGGQRQRVAMGRAIVRNPQVFLFDEPLSNLDAKLRVAMRIQIKRLHEMLGTTTIYVTHDQVEAMTLADRVVILRHGEIVQAGPPVEVYSSPNCQFVGEFIGSPQMNVLRARVQRLADETTLEIADAHIPVKQIDLPTGTEIHVGIRPEHLNWCAREEACFSPLLDVYEPLGSDTMAICLLDGQELTARLDPKLPLKRKEKIHLNFSTENLHVFDRENGRRVPFVA